MENIKQITKDGVEIYKKLSQKSQGQVRLARVYEKQLIQQIKWIFFYNLHEMLDMFEEKLQILTTDQQNQTIPKRIMSILNKTKDVSLIQPSNRYVRLSTNLLSNYKQKLFSTYIFTKAVVQVSFQVILENLRQIFGVSQAYIKVNCDQIYLFFKDKTTRQKLTSLFKKSIKEIDVYLGRKCSALMIQRKDFMKNLPLITQVIKSTCVSGKNQSLQMYERVLKRIRERERQIKLKYLTPEGLEKKIQECDNNQSGQQ